MKTTSKLLAAGLLFLACLQTVDAGVWFRTAGFESSAEGIVYVRNGKTVPVPIIDQLASGFFEHAGPEPLVFHRVETDAEGKETLIPVGQVAIPDGATQLLLIARASADGKRIAFVALEDSFEKFPAGKILFANFSNLNSALKLGDSPVVQIAARGNTLLDLPPLEQRGSIVLNLMVARTNGNDGDWTKALDSRLRFWGSSRYVIIATDTGHMNAYYLWILEDNLRRAQRQLDAARNTALQGSGAATR